MADFTLARGSRTRSWTRLDSRATRMACLAVLSCSVSLHVSAAPQTAPILDKLLAVHPFSAAAAVTSTPDGDYVFSGEGGSIALIDQRGSSVPTLHQGVLQAAMNSPIWREAIGTQGVLPVDLLLDPLADITNAANTNNVLYIAGGRDGVWTMKVNTTGSPFAVRIDDANGAMVQGNRKYCNALEIITLEDSQGVLPPKDYLAAVFARKDTSHLCIYDLALVRTAANATTESGNELSPVLGVRILRHPNANASNKHSFPFGMAVLDQDLYLAMGFHGLLRTSLTRTGVALSASQTWGPIFGDGSAYATNTTGAVNTPTLYESYHYHESVGGPSVYDHPPMFLDVAASPPGADHPWIYAAVDHLGWCAFRVGSGATWGPFITGPDFRHEGLVTSSPTGEMRIRLGPPPQPGLPDEQRTYAQRLALTLVPGTVPESQALCLAVGTVRDPFLLGVSHLNEGRALKYDLETSPIPGATKGVEEWGGTSDFVKTYNVTGISGWQMFQEHSMTSVDTGPCVVLPLIQSPGELLCYAGSNAERTQISSVNYIGAGGDQLNRYEFGTWPPPPSAIPVTGNIGISTRDRQWRPGRFCYSLGVSKLNPDHLITAGNDGATVPGGPLTLDLHSPVPSFHEDFWRDPNSGSYSTFNEYVRANAQYAVGIIGNMDSGWLASNGTSTLEYRMGARKFLTLAFDIRWRMTQSNGGSNVFGLGPGAVVEPLETKEVYFEAPSDKFRHVATPGSPGMLEQAGRHYYSTSFVSEEYNAYLQQHPIYSTNPRYQEGIVFKSQFGTPLGIWALSARNLRLTLDQQAASGNHVELSYVTSDDPVLGALVTHPEYWNVPDLRHDSGATSARNFILVEKLHGHTATFESTMLRVPSATGVGDERWLLAVACGRPVLDENLSAFGSNQNWIPDAPFRTGAGFDRMMLRFFDVSNPDEIQPPGTVQPSGAVIAANHDSANVQAVTLLGPVDETTSNFIAASEFAESVIPPGTGTMNRDFVFVTELSGALYVYEVTNILQNQPTLHAGDLAQQHFGAVLTQVPFAKVNLLPTFSDELRGNAYGLAVDTVVTGTVTPEPDLVVAYVYVSTFRAGVEVYEFKPYHQSAMLRRVGIIQTPGGSSGVHIHRYPVGHNPYGVVMFVADDHAGVRAYTYRD